MLRQRQRGDDSKLMHYPVAGVIDSSIFELLDVWQREGSAPQPVPDPMAKAISDLAKELRAARKQRESIEVRLRAAEAELESLRVPQADAGSPAQSAPRTTAR